MNKNKIIVNIGIVALGFIIMASVIILISVLTPGYEPTSGFKEVVLYYAIAIATVNLVILSGVFLTDRAEANKQLKLAHDEFRMLLNELRETVNKAKELVDRLEKGE